MGARPRNNRLFDRIAAELAGAAERSGDTESEPSSGDETTPTRRPGTLRDHDPSGGVLLDGSGAWPAPDISTQMARPIIAERQCSRTGCSDSAAVTLSYDYRSSHVWIDHLTPEREPHLYDMCERHAEKLSVMRGWQLDDRRGVRRGGLIAV